MKREIPIRVRLPTILFFSDTIAAYRIVRKMVPTAITTQILTGHGGFSKYLYLFRCKDSPSCICVIEFMTVQYLMSVMSKPNVTVVVRSECNVV